jgi:poly(3-hydroxybutyrate) depolymerase
LNDVNVKLILHPEMGHNWPYIQNYNIDASQEVWDFVSKYNLYGLIN